ncbi:MAG: glutathione S-transferase [Cyanobium sp. CACIAM 14]|nr:MAG: glutathione S-transferase [Cyanobium sp. CACIAM 14]
MTLTLYGGPRTRASIVRWYLEEKAIPYTLHSLDMQAGEHRQEPFLHINPFGKVPALVDHAFTGADGEPLRLFESGAILMHLAEHRGREFEGSGADAAVRRSLTAQWVLFANATLAPALFLAESRPEELHRILTALDSLLVPGLSLLAGVGGEVPWGAADCAVQATLAYIPLFLPRLDLSPWQAIGATIAATGSRAAFRRAMDQP